MRAVPAAAAEYARATPVPPAGRHPPGAALPSGHRPGRTRLGERRSLPCRNSRCSRPRWWAASRSPSGWSTGPATSSSTTSTSPRTWAPSWTGGTRCATSRPGSAAGV